MKAGRLGLLFAVALAAAAGSVGRASAQPAQTKPAPKPAAKPEAKPAAKPEAKPSAKPEAKEPAEKPAPEPEEKREDEKPEPIPEPEVPAPVGPPPAPVLPPPRADEQEPRPYLREPPPLQPIRNVDVGPDLGVVYMPSSSDSVSYHAAFAWGLHARIELLRWLGFRAYFSDSAHEVSIDRGALNVDDSQINQPDLEVTLIAGRIEPTWVVIPRLRIWGGPSFGLAYFVAPVSRSTGLHQLQSARRTGATFQPGGALGATFDVIPEWLTAQLWGSAAATVGQTGDAFEPPQSFDTDGTRFSMEPLPKFAGSFAMMASVGLVL